MSPGVLAVFLVASAAAAPAEKAGTWVELRSPTFVLLTDAGAKAARRTIVRFEKIRAALSAVLPSAELSGERELLVVAARNEKSLRSLVPQWWESKDGIRPSTVHLTGRDHVFILVRTDLREDDDESYHAAHWGYAAHLIGLNVPQLPLWALRGFADFYARTTVQSDRVVVGRAAVSHVRVLRERGLMPVTTLFAVDRQSPDYLDRARLRRFDAEAWALVHYLMLGEKGAHRPEVGRFLWLLGEGRPAANAAREAFGDTEALDKALATYVQSRAFYKEAIPADLETAPRTTTERPLSSAEGLTLRAAVHLASERYPDAHACLEEAIRLDPTLAWAHEIRAATAWAEDDPIVAREAVVEALRLDADRALARRLQTRLAGPPTVRGAERLCDAGDLAACTTLGGWLIDGNTTTPDPARGVSRLDRACTEGHTDACRQLSWRFRQGKGVTLDAAASADLPREGLHGGRWTGLPRGGLRLPGGPGRRHRSRGRGPNARVRLHPGRDDRLPDAGLGPAGRRRRPPGPPARRRPLPGRVPRG